MELEDNQEGRTSWASKLGFILAAVGSAVGLGAIWRFPYLTGSNGGSAFIIPYIFFNFTIGLVLLRAEIAFGRLGRGAPVTAIKNLLGKKFAVFGYVQVLSVFLLVSYYCVIGGWCIAYLVDAITGMSAVGDTKDLVIHFESFVASPIKAIAFHGVFLVMTAVIVAFGVQAGIERFSKVLLPLLFILMSVLIIRGVTLDGAWAGVEYLLKPDWTKLTAGALVEAFCFAFFGLSLGMGIMVTYGSYLPKEACIPHATAWVVGSAAIVAVLAGLMVLPPVFAFGLDPGAGPGLTFITMPAVFMHMPLGSFFASLFYICLTVAALTSSISMIEVVVATMEDEWEISRRNAAILSAVILFFVGMPSALSFGVLSDKVFLGKTFFDAMDYLTANILIPLSALVVALVVGWKIWPNVGVDVSGALHENRPLWVKSMKFLVAIVCPILIILVLLRGVMS